MSRLKCNDCGTTFESTMDSCPTCGCPINYCNVIEEAGKVCESQDDGRESYQNYYYVDFDWLESFSSDPRILTYLTNVKFLKWLCAPWHISETNNTLNHIIANDIFFLFNRFWKLFVYGVVWAYCKGLPIIVLTIVLTCILSKYYDAYVIVRFLTILTQIAVLWFMWIGFGKSCKRYGIPLIAALRHLYVTVNKDIKDNLK